MSRIPFRCLAGLVCSGFAFGGIAPATPLAAAGLKKIAANPANTQLTQQLEAVRATLNRADHDYQGHRAAAVHQITHAAHLLHHGKPHPKPGQQFVGGKHTEPQAVSDSQLRQSLAALQSLAVPPGPHQAQVQAALAKAVASLHIALTVA